MKNKSLYLIGGVAITAILGRIVYKNLYLAGQWDFRMGTFALKTLKPLTITQTIDFINKSNIKVKVKDIQITALTNGVKIGEINAPEEQEIEGKGFSPFTITYVLNPNLGDQKVKDALTKSVASYLNTKDIPVDFIGRVKVKTLFGYTEIPIRYSSTGKNLYQIWYEYYNS